uniref:Uncharacterized protein n=1 Tax=Arundo donax TaxID=35708 RepID=A0A0A8YJN6_ARUDO
MISTNSQTTVHLRSIVPTTIKLRKFVCQRRGYISPTNGDITKSPGTTQSPAMQLQAQGRLQLQHDIIAEATITTQ